MERMYLVTPRLVIRNLLVSDLADFHAYRSNPEVTKYQGFDVMSLEEAEAFIHEQKDKEFGKAGEWVQYGIVNKITKSIIGDCAIKLQESDDRIAEIGITISHTQQNNGYARETILGVLSFLFDEKKIHRVVEITDAENSASINLLKSTGFRLEGHFIENIFFKGAWGSEYQYAMLKSEWDKRNSV